MDARACGASYGWLDLRRRSGRPPAQEGGKGVPTLSSGLGMLSPAEQEQMERDSEEYLRQMPRHIQISEAIGGWIISGESHKSLNRQRIATTIEEVLDIVRESLTR